MEHRRAVRHRGGGQQCGHIGRGPAAVERRLDRAGRQRPAGTERREVPLDRSRPPPTGGRRPELPDGEPAGRHYQRCRVQHTAPLRALDHGFGRQMWQLHVDGPTRLVDALVPRLVDGGRVVVIGSRTSSGAHGKSQYAATTAAVAGLTRSWPMGLAPRRITVDVVAPDPTETTMLEDPARVSTRLASRRRIVTSSPTR